MSTNQIFRIADYEAMKSAITGETSGIDRAFRDGFSGVAEQLVETMNVIASDRQLTPGAWLVFRDDVSRRAKVAAADGEISAEEAEELAMDAKALKPDWL